MEYSIRTVKEEDAASIVELLNPIIQAGHTRYWTNSFRWTINLTLFVGFPNEAFFCGGM